MFSLLAGGAGVRPQSNDAGDGADRSGVPAPEPHSPWLMCDCLRMDMVQLGPLSSAWIADRPPASATRGGPRLVLAEHTGGQAASGTQRGLDHGDETQETTPHSLVSAM